jgi:hypothetical protein
VKHLSTPEFDAFLHELHRVLEPRGLALTWEFGPTGNRRLDAWRGSSGPPWSACGCAPRGRCAHMRTPPASGSRATLICARSCFHRSREHPS